MSTFDKLFAIECQEPYEHFIRYVRNESMIDHDRWYGMLEAKDPNDLYDRLVSDIENSGLPKDYQHNRLCRLRLNEILEGDAISLFDKIFNHLGTGTCDKPLFMSTILRMRSMQDVYLERIDRIRSGEVDTPVSEAIYRFMMKDP